MAPQVEMETVGGLRVRMLRARRESKMGRESKTGRESKMGRESKILFLHGANGFPGWLPMFERLAESHEVWVPEHPGFGASDDAPGLVNVSDFAYYYLDFLERYDLREVHVMGHSLGGWIASEVAVRDCSRFASLTLFAPAGVRIKGIQTGDNFIWAPDEAVRTVFYDQALAERILSRVIGEEEQDQIIRTRLMAARLGWEPRWFNPHLEKWLHRIHTPTLLLWGAEDRLLPAAYAKVWQERVPGIQSEIFGACGHSPHIEQTEKVLARLDGFLGGPRA